MELFDETWIYDKWNWEVTNPVIKISFAGLDYRNQGLEKAIDFFLEEEAEKINYKFKHSDYSGKFIELIEHLGKENGVVILIDEYDKPIIDYINKEHRETADENRQILKNFYSGLKDCDKYIKLLSSLKMETLLNFDTPVINKSFIYLSQSFMPEYRFFKISLFS